MTYPMDPERIKALMRAKVVEGRCDTCNRVSNFDRCSRVECPHRKPEQWAPDTAGTTPIKRHQGWDG